MTNVTIPATGTGTATPVVSTDVVSADSSNVQNVQLTSVASGVMTRLGTAGSPLEVAIVGTVPISGAPTTVTANLGTIGGAATQTTLAAVLAALGTPLQAGGNVAVTASALPTGASTETTLAAVNTKLGSSLPLMTGAATQTTLASVLSALQGTLTVTGGGTPADLTASGSITAINQTVPITSMNGMTTCNVQVSGTFSATLFVDLTIDGTNWFSPPGFGQPINDPSGLLFTNSSFTTAQNFQLSVAGAVGVRIRCSAFVSGTATINLRASAGGHVVSLGASLPTGINVIGAVKSQPIQSGSATLTQVAGSATSVTLFNATTRTGLVIVNDSTANLKVAFASSASATAYTYLMTAGATLELPTAGRVMYNGAISGIWASATGNAVLTEIT